MKQLTLEGHRADGPPEAPNGDAKRFSALRHLWARQRIDELTDQEYLLHDGSPRWHLPEGVGNLASSGTYVPSTPEPSTLGAVFVTLSMVAMIARRRSRQRRHHMTL